MKKLSKKLAVFVMLCGNVLIANAQQTKSEGTEKYSQRLQAILKPSSTKYWLDIKQELRIKPISFLDEYKSDLNLSSNDVFKQYKAMTDEANNHHYRYQQFYKGLKIEGAECIVHEQKGYMNSINGRWLQNYNAEVKPGINETSALNMALANIKSKDYLWKRKLSAELIDRIKANGYSVYPKGELVLCRKNWDGDFTTDNMSLAWKFTIVVYPMNESGTFYVDAKNGSITHKSPIQSDCETGTGNTTCYGTQSFNTSYVGFPAYRYYLDYDEGCTGYNTSVRVRRGDPIIPFDYANADNTWFDADGVNGYNQRAGVTTYYSLINANNYYKNALFRNSYNNAGAAIEAFDEITGSIWVNDDNANWNSFFLTLQFGAGVTSSPTDDFNTLDICGHELTHGVTQFSANLDYSNESGALNESFSDIFGEMTQLYARGTTDWIIASELGGFRSFSNPNSKGHPDTYQGSFWHTGTDDNGGVHENSSVQNFWYYLLCNGGSGTNDNGESYSVSALGTSIPAQIAYRNLTYYLTSSSQYVDARNGAIHAAIDLWGSCSSIVLATANAWHAVGVGENYFADNVCGNYTSATLINYLFRGFDVMKVSQNCTATLSSLGGGSFAFVSGKEINFYPGFTATQNVNLSAYIDPCVISYYPLTNTSNTAAISTQSTVTVEQKKPVEVSGNIKIYPNPATGYINIQTSDQLNKSSCYITDITGKRFACKWKGAGNTIDISALSPGIYFMNVNALNKITTIKFVKL